MKTEDILSHVDHTLLKAAASWEEIRKLSDEAVKYQTASVCVPSSYVKKIQGKLSPPYHLYGGRVSFGNGNSESKAEETNSCPCDGADEIDMVINIGAVKNKNYDLVTEEIAVLKRNSGRQNSESDCGNLLSDRGRKIRLCECVTKGGADYIKTSTGFGTAGASLADIALFRKHIGKM